MRKERNVCSLQKDDLALEWSESDDDEEEAEKKPSTAAEPAAVPPPPVTDAEPVCFFMELLIYRR